jgi:hypothetical protein
MPELGSGAVTLDDANLDLVGDGRIVGVRFQNVELPPGSTIRAPCSSSPRRPGRGDRQLRDLARRRATPPPSAPAPATSARAIAPGVDELVARRLTAGENDNEEQAPISPQSCRRSSASRVGTTAMRWSCSSIPAQR